MNYKRDLFVRKLLCALSLFLPFLCMQAQRAGFTADDLRSHPSKPGFYLLVGNSRIVSKGNIVYSDRAEYNPVTESCEAYGNLRVITSDKVRITGRILNYNGQTQLFDIIDDVVLIDGSITMKTQRLLFDARNNVATYNTPAEMTDKETVLTSKRGQYFGKTKTFQCRQDVIIVNPEYTIWSDTMNYRTGLAHFFGPTNLETDDYYMYCEYGFYNKNTEKVSLKNNAYIKTQEQTLFGDSIYYDLGSKYGNVHRNVRMIDTMRNLFVWSEYAENNEAKGTAYFTQKVRAAMLEEGAVDTLFLVSDTLKVRYDTSRQVQQILGYNKVRFYRSDLQGLCDSLSYDAVDSVMYLHKNPLVWAQDYQIKGDTIRVWFRNQKPEKLLINENAFMVSNPENTNYFNQVKAKRIYGYFDDKSQLETIEGKGNSESIYYVQEEKTGDLIGINKSQSKNLRLYLRDSEITGVNFVEPEKNALYPEEMLNANEIKLKGFVWLIEKRPRSKYDLSSDW